MRLSVWTGTSEKEASVRKPDDLLALPDGVRKARLDRVPFSESEALVQVLHGVNACELRRAEDGGPSRRGQGTQSPDEKVHVALSAVIRPTQARQPCTEEVAALETLLEQLGNDTSLGSDTLSAVLDALSDQGGVTLGVLKQARQRLSQPKTVAKLLVRDDLLSCLLDSRNGQRHIGNDVLRPLAVFIQNFVYRVRRRAERVLAVALEAEKSDPRAALECLRDLEHRIVELEGDSSLSVSADQLRERLRGVLGDAVDAFSGVVIEPKLVQQEAVKQKLVTQMAYLLFDRARENFFGRERNSYLALRLVAAVMGYCNRYPFLRISRDAVHLHEVIEDYRRTEGGGLVGPLSDEEVGTMPLLPRAHQLVDEAILCFVTFDVDMADNYLREALELFRHLEDEAGVARVMAFTQLMRQHDQEDLDLRFRDFAERRPSEKARDAIKQRREDLERAFDLGEQAWATIQRAKAESGERQALMASAQQNIAEACTLYRRWGEHVRSAHRLRTMGVVALELEDSVGARKFFEQARVVFEQHFLVVPMARCWDGIASSYVQESDEEAFECFQRALELLTLALARARMMEEPPEQGVADAQQLRVSVYINQSIAHCNFRRFGEAERSARKARQAAEAMGDDHQVARARRAIKNAGLMQRQAEQKARQTSTLPDLKDRAALEQFLERSREGGVAGLVSGLERAGKSPKPQPFKKSPGRTSDKKKDGGKSGAKQRPPKPERRPRKRRR